MDGAEQTAAERAASLDRVAGRFIGNSNARAYDLAAGTGFAAMIDSDTSEDEAVFVWVGRWPERPESPARPAIEIVATRNRDDLRRRRGFTTADTPTAALAPHIRDSSGELTRMEPITAPGFSAAWIGEHSNTAVAVFVRDAIDPSTWVIENADVEPLAIAWRELVDGNGPSHISVREIRGSRG